MQGESKEELLETAKRGLACLDEKDLAYIIGMEQGKRESRKEENNDDRN